MADFKAKRKEITNLVLNVVEILAGGKHDNNYDRLDIFLNQMSDSEFEEWAKWCNNPQNPDELDHTIQLFYDQFKIPSLTNVKNALDFINVPMEEFIYYRDLLDEGVRSKVPVPVGYISVKRQQQMISKKNKYTTDSDDVDPKTGQVRGDSKVAAISDNEAVGLIGMNADVIMKELFGARGQNQEQKQHMYRQIARNGYFSLNDAVSDSKDLTKNTALNTLNIYLLGAGIKSDLITNSLKTSYTIKKEYELYKK